jgi:hypothetical protein
MKNIYLGVCCIFIFSVPVYSQAYDGSIEYDKKKQQAILIDYAHSQEAVENAIIQRIEKQGSRAKIEKGIFNKNKGFVVFKNAFVKDISDNSMDYIIKLERKSRKQKEETTLYLIMIKDGENAIATLDEITIGKAKSFLSNMLPEIEEASLELQIKSQDETVAKAEKKCLNLSEDQNSLEKKIKNLQADLEKNMKDQVNQQKEIEYQRLLLEELKTKRKVPQ